MTSYLLVVNPISGRGRTRAKAEALAGRLAESCEVRIVQTTGSGSAAKLAADPGGEVDRVIAVGGDGTVNEVLAGLMSLGRPAAGTPALGFLPSGTGNVTSQAFELASDPEAAARALPTAEVRAVDVGIVSFAESERPFLLWCGAGFDAVAMEALGGPRTGPMGVVGLIGAVPRVLGALARYSAPPIRSELDGVVVEDAASVIVANVGEVAFGGRVVETADPADGRLDVIGVAPAGWPKLLGLGLRMLISSLSPASGVLHRRATRVRLSAEKPVPVQVDGEAAGFLPVTVRLRPAAVRLLLTGRAQAP